jgi:hypothetical protein
MALVLKDRVKETTTTTGTGSFTLDGAVTGYDSFGQIGTGNTTYYAVYLDGGSEWEVGIGTYTAPSTLSRDTILASSNSGSVVTFSAGQKTIWCDYPAGKAVYTDASGNISRTIGDISAVTGAIQSPESIQFDTNPSVVPTAEGALFWDNAKGSLAYIMQGGDVTQEIGESQYLFIQASSSITKGQVVMFTGAIGGSGIPTGAPATGITDGTYIMGIAAEDITSGTEGFVQTFGILKPINTTGIATGEILWYDPAVTGGYTTVKPSAPNVKVQVAAVTAGNSAGGALLVRITAGTKLGETDSNVLFSTLTGGNLLIYDQTNSYWKNANLTDGTAISITETAGGTVTIENTGVTALTGTANEIDVSASTGSITLSLPATINVDISGNAATVTNGVYTTGSYADPSWITSLDGSKITGTLDGGSF